MRIGRTLPPAAAPIPWINLLYGVLGMVGSASALERFERELRKHFKRKHCFLLTSGTAALTVALKSLRRLHPGRDRVLLPAFTCYSVPAAVERAGLQVKLCDLAPGSLDFDWQKLPAALHDRRLLCVVPTHLLGCAADVTRLRSTMKEQAIPVVEDAAQAFGAQWQGIRLGSSGDAAVFSLGRGKALSTVQGGVLLTDDARLATAVADEMRGLPRPGWRNQFGMLAVALALKILSHPLLFWLPRGIPALRLGETRYQPRFALQAMSGLQAGLSRGWQERLGGLRRVRETRACSWSRALHGTSLPGFPDEGSLANLLRYPLECSSQSERDQLLQQSERLGLGLAAVYPDTVAGIAGLRGELKADDYPVARRIARRMITLPVHAWVTARDRRRILALLSRGDADAAVLATPMSGRAS